MKVHIDKDICCECGCCVNSCPEVFTMGEDGIEILIRDVPEELDEKLQEAIDICPGDFTEKAIIIEEAG